MGRAESVILTYHSIDDGDSVISVSPQLFREQIRDLCESGVPLVPLSRVRSTPGAMALTFDDGYRNFLEHALPVLAEGSIPATVFPVTGYCGKDSRWSGKSPSLPLMDWGELRSLADYGIEIGGHSVMHRDLRELTDRDLAGDLDGCRKQLEDGTGKTPAIFAYPYGAVDARVRRFTSERFSLACGTRLRPVNAESDPWDLPRLDIYYWRNRRRFHDLLQGRARGYMALRRFLRETAQRRPFAR